MMLPIVGYRISFSDLFFGAGRNAEGGLEVFWRQRASTKRLFFVNSGTAACFFLLSVLKERSTRRDVILPAYTASALVQAVLQAGLRPVLCDMERDGFNMDVSSLEALVSDDTLAVLCVYMFGLPVEGVASLRTRLPREVVLIEDCAQAMGSEVGGQPVGTFGDMAFFSFNRGKNCPLYGGGVIVINDDQFLFDMDKAFGILKNPDILCEAKIFVKMLCFKAALNRFVYHVIYSLLGRREGAAKGSFDGTVMRFARVHRRHGACLMRRFTSSCEERRRNAAALIRGLAVSPDVILPVIRESDTPVLNRMPIFIKDPQKRDLVRQRLLRAGIQSSEFYFKPLHHIFDLGYERGAFPHAERMAQSLLTLPVHPLVTERDIDTILDVIKEALGS